MKRINNLEELCTSDANMVWAWSSWEGYGVWEWQGRGICEMAPTDMASWYSVEDIPDHMFPMYFIPDPPAKPETIDGSVAAKEIEK
jgi:hypothetical protein